MNLILFSLPYLLPLLIVIFWRKQPTRALLLAMALLFLGLVILNYFATTNFMREFEIDQSEFSPWAFEALVLGGCLQPFLIGVGLLLIMRLMAQYFMKKKASKKYINSTFE